MQDNNILAANQQLVSKNMQELGEQSFLEKFNKLNLEWQMTVVACGSMPAKDLQHDIDVRLSEIEMVPEDKQGVLEEVEKLQKEMDESVDLGFSFSLQKNDGWTEHSFRLFLKENPTPQELCDNLNACLAYVVLRNDYLDGCLDDFNKYKIIVPIKNAAEGQPQHFSVLIEMDASIGKPGFTVCYGGEMKLISNNLGKYINNNLKQLKKREMIKDAVAEFVTMKDLSSLQLECNFDNIDEYCKGVAFFALNKSKEFQLQLEDSASVVEIEEVLDNNSVSNSNIKLSTHPSRFQLPKEDALTNQDFNFQSN